MGKRLTATFKCPSCDRLTPSQGMECRVCWTASRNAQLRHNEALATLKEAFRNGRAGVQGLIALSNDFAGITITVGEIRAIVSEVQAARKVAQS